MLFNTISATASIKRISEIFRSSLEATGQLSGSHHDEVLNNLQNIVAQGAALSRYFWPARKGHEGRAELLRSALGVTEESVLKSRDLRNAIEHFDEELDNYLSGGIVGYIIPQYVGPLSQGDGVPCHIFRAYYTDRSIFELLGKQYEIEPIAEEIARIHCRLESCSVKGGRLSPGGV
jgi:hypothetical protein